MRYNQLTYHKANPFYLQDFLPDRAWYNRKPKDFPSQIPTGQQYFTDNGRRHYTNRFNHSQIQQCGVLKSPQRYPCENRIALQKTYMRNLDTTDIQGAGSGTRVGQAVKNKLRAQQQLARRYNQSLDMKQHKEHVFQQKRRQLALRQFQTIQEKKKYQEDVFVQKSRMNNPQRNLNTIDNNKNMQKQIQKSNFDSYNINNEIQNSQNMRNHQQNDENTKYQQQQLSKLPQQSKQVSRQAKSNHEKYQQKKRIQYEPYHQQYPKKGIDYHRTLQIQQLAKSNFRDKKDFRKYNPTNLSFNIAAQSIVNGKH